MNHTISKLLTGLLMVSLLTTGVPALAGVEDEPSAAEMAGDLLVARPVGAAITAAGTLIFLASLPLSALGGNVSEAADKLVISPARETFVRCLGCQNVGRYRKPKEDTLPDADAE